MSKPRRGQTVNDFLLYVVFARHGEFKRGTKPMEIVPGEASCCRLLAFISLKMELILRSNPAGKVGENPPFFNQIQEI
ncbi:MAG: hypothetical protein V3S64_03920 [bacterium]